MIGFWNGSYCYLLTTARFQSAQRNDPAAFKKVQHNSGAHYHELNDQQVERVMENSTFMLSPTRERVKIRLGSL
jgi:hypothetical protein